MSEIDLSGLKIGMESTLSIIVSNENSAEAVGYKGMSVLGTPHLVGVMETACIFVHEFLPENYLTVGIANRMKHLAPSPIGATVTAIARLIAIEGRKLTYDVEAHDSVEKVAEGTHIRFIIDSRIFFCKYRKKERKAGSDLKNGNVSGLSSALLTRAALKKSAPGDGLRVIWLCLYRGSFC